MNALSSNEPKTWSKATDASNPLAPWEPSPTVIVADHAGDAVLCGQTWVAVRRQTEAVPPTDSPPSTPVG